MQMTINDKIKRHIITLLASTVLILIIEQIRTAEGWGLKMHTWNKAFGDVSILYVVLTLAIGSLSRISDKLAFLRPWARPIGIWAMVFALVHIIIVIGGWDDWNIWWLLGFTEIRDGSTQFNLPGFGFANVIGFIAALYGLVLLATSNDSSIKKLGTDSWKYLQQRSAHFLYVLASLHTVYFLFYYYYSYGRQAPPPNFFRTTFIIIIIVITIIQALAFFKVIKKK